MKSFFKWGTGGLPKMKEEHTLRVSCERSFRTKKADDEKSKKPDLKDSIPFGKSEVKEQQQGSNRCPEFSWVSEEAA